MPAAAPRFGRVEAEQGTLRLRLVTWTRATEESQALSGKRGRRVRISQYRVPIQQKETLLLHVLIQEDAVLAQPGVERT